MEKFAVDLDKVLDDFEKTVEQEDNWQTPACISSESIKEIEENTQYEPISSNDFLNGINESLPSENGHADQPQSMEINSSLDTSSSQSLLIKLSPMTSETLVTVDTLINTNNSPKIPELSICESLDPLANCSHEQTPKTSLLNSASFEALFINNVYPQPIINEEEGSSSNLEPTFAILNSEGGQSNILDDVKRTNTEIAIENREQFSRESKEKSLTPYSSLSESKPLLTEQTMVLDHTERVNIQEIKPVGFERVQELEDAEISQNLDELDEYLKSHEEGQSSNKELPSVIENNNPHYRDTESYPNEESESTTPEELSDNISPSNVCNECSPYLEYAQSANETSSEEDLVTPPQEFSPEYSSESKSAIEHIPALESEQNISNSLARYENESTVSHESMPRELNQAHEENTGALTICNGVPSHPDHLPHTLRPTSLNLTCPNTVNNSSPDSEHPSPVAEQPIEPTEPVSHQQLGFIKPFWIPDCDASNCMLCNQKFTVIKRRHHCRTCGKVLCSQCCNLKKKLPYLQNKEGRVCIACHTILTQAEARLAINSPGMTPFHGVPPPNSWSPNPSNPQEYCSTIPPYQQVSESELTPPTVMVPVGVLKRDSDSPDPSEEGSSRWSGSNSLRKHQMRKILVVDEEGALPPIILPSDSPPNFKPTAEELLLILENEKERSICFALTKNLKVNVKLVKLNCCSKQEVWSFRSQGLACVGQDEVLLLLERIAGEHCIPREAFSVFNRLWDEASHGQPVGELGHLLFPEGILGSRDHSGFVMIKPTFQCLERLDTPEHPFLIALLIQRWETPWAKLFPLRLILRLGAEYRYYPCPIVSQRFRKPVYCEVGHTIMNVLADFRNFQFTIPTVSGVVVHIEDKLTTMKLPLNHYDKIIKLVTNSNEHVLSFGAHLSLEADSHLVSMQKDDGHYFTQAISKDESNKKITGASFIVFSGALKPASGLSAKSSMVEDGLLVQITSDTFEALKAALHKMENFDIKCGSSDSSNAGDEQIKIQWVNSDSTLNNRVLSPIDGKSMAGVTNIRIHTATDYVGENYLIRWTEVFFFQVDSNNTPRMIEPTDPSRLAESASEACCLALTPYLDMLVDSNLLKIGLRLTIDSENVGYDIGALGSPLPSMYMDMLDMALIPVITSASGNPLVFELIFHILVK